MSRAEPTFPGAGVEPDREGREDGGTTGAWDQPVGSDPRVPQPASTRGWSPARPGTGPRPARLGLRLRALALTPLLVVVTLGLGWLVWSMVEWRRGRTPGYRVVGLYVVRRSDGRRAGWLRSALRALCCAVLVLPTIAVCCLLALAFVMGASPPNDLLRRARAAPWDLLSSTTVVEERRRGRRLVLGGDWPADASMDGLGTGYGSRQN